MSATVSFKDLLLLKASLLELAIDIGRKDKVVVSLPPCECAQECKALSKSANVTQKEGSLALWGPYGA